MAKKIICLMLVIISLVSIAPVRVFAADENTVISNIQVTDFVIPKEGEDASALTPTLTLGEGYTLRSSKWFDSEDAAFTGTFEGGKTYRANLHLLAEDGYEFAPNESISATVNGGALTVSNVSIGNYSRLNSAATVSVLFTVENNEAVINKIDITDFVIPKEGEDASALTPTLTLGEGYTLKSAKWFDSEDATFTGAFEGGKTYRVNLHLFADDGYEFAPNESIAVTVNGGALTVSSVTVGRYYRYNDVVNVSVLFTVEDDEHIISRIDMICEQGAIPFNTYYTEGQCFKVLCRGNVIKFADGEPIADDGTDFGFANAMTGLAGSPENLDADTDYYIQCTVGLKDEYDWIETAKKDADSISQIQGLTVTFNGVQVTDSIYYYVGEINAIVFDIPIGKPDTEPVIESVNIIEEDFAMSQNSGHTFTAEVLGNEENKKVIWTVEGAQNPHNTIISVDGYLNISYDETAEFITVKATSEADPTKFDTVKITVLEKEPTIDLIIVEEPGELYPSDGAIMDVEAYWHSDQQGLWYSP